MEEFAIVTNEVMLAMLTIAILMMGIALFYWKNQPPRINKLYGYRTKRSMQHIEVWRAANAHSAKMFINHGLVLLALAIVLSILKVPYSLIIFVVVLLAGIIYAAIQTSKYLKKNFDAEGNKIL